MKKLSGTFIDHNYVLISLDVISLFTNIYRLSVANRWEFISENCKIPKEEFLKAVFIVLNSTYFSFNNCFYKQTFGTLMGSPLSPIITDVVMRDLKEKILERIGTQVPFYFEYVNNITIAIVAFFFHDDILDIFNFFHPRLQFTIIWK